MKKLSRAMSSRWMSSVLSAVVLGALCFSVGEGLRLTPFPVSALSQTGQPHLSVTGKTSLAKYGPLDVPAQNQKRSKRQALDVAGPAVAKALYAPPQLSSPLDSAATDLLCVLSVTRPPGRAPPSLL
jgi:hypothetical protein